MTMKLIQTINVGSGGVSSVSFTSIPQTFTDLLLVVSARISTTTGSVWGDSALQFNGSSSGYSGRYLYGATGSGVGVGTEGTSAYNIVRIQSNDGTANTFSNTNINILNYASSAPKLVSYDSVSENNGTSSIQTIAAELWSDTAAITSLGMSTSNFAQYSSFSLYGITKGSGGATVS
jgi:hypothetical protein